MPRRHRHRPRPVDVQAALDRAAIPAEGAGPAALAKPRPEPCTLCGCVRAVVEGRLIKTCGCPGGSPFYSRQCRGDRS